MASDNTLGLSWRDSAWVPILNQANVLDYFAERTNPFYDRSCNNETIKMQRLNPSQLRMMTGLEYMLLHVQEPILYVIRKQHRHSEDQVTPLNDFYIIDGTVYQAPDLGTIINSRMMNTVHNLQTAFEEAQSYSRYHPSKGYWWEFTKEQEHTEKITKDKKKKEESSSYFQRQRVDVLLTELAKKFPPKMPNQQEKPAVEEVVVKQEPVAIKQEVKTEKPEVPPPTVAATKPPPEKKPKLMR